MDPSCIVGMQGPGNQQKPDHHYGTDGIYIPDGNPVVSGADAQREELSLELDLFQLAILTQIPHAHSVVQPARHQLGVVGRDVGARHPVKVPRELAAEGRVKERGGVALMDGEHKFCRWVC